MFKFRQLNWACDHIPHLPVPHLPATDVCRRTATTGGLIVLALLIAVATNGVVAAQEQPAYETLEIAAEFKLPDSEGVDPNDSDYKNKRNEVFTKRRNMQRQITDTLKGRGGNAAAIESWLNGFVIPEMTQTDDATLSRLGELRQRFFKFYLEDTSNPSLRSQVIDLTIPAMRRVAEGNFHPACRINAILLLGRLNAREGNRTAGVLPQPVSEMSPYLLQIATSADQPEFLRICALTGLVRHASLRSNAAANPLSGSEQRIIGDAMLEMIGQQPGETLSRDAVYWMKRRAVQILGYLGIPGDNNRYAKVLRDLIVNENESLLLRTEAAEAYAGLDFSSNPAQASVAEMTEIIGNLVAQAADADAAYLEEKTLAVEFIAQFLDGKKAEGSDDGGNRKSGPGVGGGLGEGGGDSSGDARKKRAKAEILPGYQRELVRSRFKSFLWSGRIALVGTERTQDGGLFKYASDDDKPFIRDLISDFEQVMSTTDVREPDPDAEKPEDDTSDSGPASDKVEEDPVTLAEQLRTALANGSESIRKTIVKYRPQEEAEGLPAADSGDSAPPQGN